MKKFFANSLKSENFTPCNYRLVNVGVNISTSTFDAITKQVRKDYSLFFVDSGRIIVKSPNNADEIVEEGEFFMYFPNTSQNFYCEGNSKSKITLIFFMGSELDEIIKNLKLNEGKIITKPTSKAQEILQRLLDENVNKPLGYEVMSKGLLLNLLTTLARDRVSQISTNEIKPVLGNVMSVIDKINQNPHVSNKELASDLNISVDHFVRVFKDVFKKTPHQYKLEVIMEKAKKYLLSSNLKVSQIAEILGYNNGELYFNASFKKFVGLSPTEFRKKK